MAYGPTEHGPVGVAGESGLELRTIERRGKVNLHLEAFPVDGPRTKPQCLGSSDYDFRRLAIGIADHQTLVPNATLSPSHFIEG